MFNYIAKILGYNTSPDPKRICPKCMFCKKHPVQNKLFCHFPVTFGTWRTDAAWLNPRLAHRQQVRKDKSCDMFDNKDA